LRVCGRRAEIGHRALIDAMGANDDPARGGLRSSPHNDIGLVGEGLPLFSTPTVLPRFQKIA
jgi:hypothetical protein